MAALNAGLHSFRVVLRILMPVTTKPKNAQCHQDESTRIPVYDGLSFLNLNKFYHTPCTPMIDFDLLLQQTRILRIGGKISIPPSGNRNTWRLDIKKNMAVYCKPVPEVLGKRTSFFLHFYLYKFAALGSKDQSHASFPSKTSYNGTVTTSVKPCFLYLWNDNVGLP